LSRLATYALTRRLNGRCTGTFAKNCTHLASNWTRLQWPNINWKRAFSANCTCTIICARIGRNWPPKYGRVTRTTGDKKPRPANRARRSKYRVGDTWVKRHGKDREFRRNPPIPYFFFDVVGFSLYPAAYAARPWRSACSLVG